MFTENLTCDTTSQNGSHLRQLLKRGEYLLPNSFSIETKFYSHKLQSQFNIENIKTVEGCINGCIILTTSGEVYQKGIVETIAHHIKLPFIKTICRGRDHVVAVSIFGDIFSWGCNSFGQLGLGDRVFQPLPKQIIL